MVVFCGEMGEWDEREQAMRNDRIRDLSRGDGCVHKAEIRQRLPVYIRYFRPSGLLAAKYTPIGRRKPRQCSDEARDWMKEQWRTILLPPQLN